MVSWRYISLRRVDSKYYNTKDVAVSLGREIKLEPSPNTVDLLQKHEISKGSLVAEGSAFSVHLIVSLVVREQQLWKTKEAG